MIEAAIQPTFQSWRDAARKLLQANVEPDNVIWNDSTQPTLPMLAQPMPAPVFSEITVPNNFIPLAKTVSMHRNQSRWPLLYRSVFRLTHDQPHLLDNIVDEDVYRLRELEKSVRRDLHKMHAFVRFRRLVGEAGERYIAFHRPDHLIMPAAAPWFARRFPVIRWTIMTPDASAAWDGKSIEFGPGLPASCAPEDDGLEELWRTYYANIFNPARINISAMKKEMPVRHWATLPETQIIDQLLQDAPVRVEEMMRKTSASNPTTAAQFVPAARHLPVLREAALTCKGCELYCNATQTVFGEGPADAAAMFVGEQPGDQEDLAGKPFVGPAGRLLNEAFDRVGIDRNLLYVTNAVKHFKFEQRGTRRLHAKPSAREISACKPWLGAEMETIRPHMVVALGATAAQSMMGPTFKITKNRGQVLTGTPWAPWFMATFHPSALLRIPDAALREQTYQQFIADLSVAAQELVSASRA